MNFLFQDLKIALRSLSKSPGFLLVSVLTLALGIGASTTIFSIVDSVLLKPLPFEDPDRLVMVRGLLVRSFVSLTHVSPGFRTDGTLTFRANLTAEPGAELERRISLLPGVAAVARANRAPLSGPAARGPFVPVTIAVEDARSYPAKLFAFVTPGYFEAMAVRCRANGYAHLCCDHVAPRGRCRYGLLSARPARGRSGSVGRAPRVDQRRVPTGCRSRL